MSYKHKYEKYKNKYLNTKKNKIGGSLNDDLLNIVSTMSIDDLLKIDIDSIKRHIVDTILDNKKFVNGDFDKIKVLEELGNNLFGMTNKLQIYDDIIKNNEIIIKKGTIVTAKFISINENTEKYFNGEIISHTLVSLAKCDLPKLYGYFENVTYNEKIYNVIISEYINGINLLKELESTQYDVDNNEHLYLINLWVNKLEKNIECLHTNNIVHKDINLNNIMIKYDQNNNVTNGAILTDYNMACRYPTFCANRYHTNYTSPIKYQNMNNKNKNKSNISTSEIDKLNDYYSFGIVILDVLSKMIPFKTLFNDQLFSDTLKINKETINFSIIMENINKFITQVSIRNGALKELTNKASKYIKFGLPNKELDSFKQSNLQIENISKYANNEETFENENIPENNQIISEPISKNIGDEKQDVIEDVNEDVKQDVIEDVKQDVIEDVIDNIPNENVSDDINLVNA